MLEFWPFLEPAINDTRRGFGLASVVDWASVFADHDRLLGAGLTLPVEATVAQLARAVEEVLSQPSYRRAAQSIASASRRDGGPPAAADELESLLA
jgi:hypothetical protein